MAGKGVKNGRRGTRREAGNTLHSTLWILLMILIFDLRGLGCHLRVLNSGMMGSELHFENFILLLLSGEGTRSKTGRPIGGLF